VACLLRPGQRALLNLFRLAFMTPQDRGAIEVEVFTTEGEALAWLGVRPA